VTTKTYGAGGRYTAKLIVKDPGGNEDSVLKTIEVATNCPRRPGGRRRPAAIEPKTASGAFKL
jgi:hypothetical protein